MAAQPSVRPEAVSPRKASEILGVHVCTIYRRIYDKSLPTIRIGRVHRILLSTLRQGTERG